MARKKTLEELQAEREKAEQDLRIRQETLTWNELIIHSIALGWIQLSLFVTMIS